MKQHMVILIGLALAGCAGDGAAPRTGHRPAAYVPLPSQAGLGKVIGDNAGSLMAMFGQPQADVREGDARKLQFGNATCVLDAYLYPKGSGEPIVDYVDARQANGSPIDRASCVGALQASRRR
ncbi:MAG: hypothetical protein M3R41_02830 [Pseudomonadota bacterium]|nr:hypothetical protein [Pseudomonadota bacterium]